jgi:PKD repeat protein
VGTNCANANCPQPSGACCFSNGFCLSLTSAQCNGAGGSWAGAFTTCADGNGNGQADICEAGCDVDFNGDGFVDFFDYDDYVNCFETTTCPPGKNADFNNDGFVDFFDYDEFVAAFEAGC